MSNPSMIFKFVHAPDVGFAVEVGGQVFKVAKVEHYRRTDGAYSSIITWRTACPKCAKPVTFQTGQGLAIRRKHCDDHKLAGRTTHA